MGSGLANGGSQNGMSDSLPLNYGSTGSLGSGPGRHFFPGLVRLASAGRYQPQSQSTFWSRSQYGTRMRCIQVSCIPIPAGGTFVRPGQRQMSEGQGDGEGEGRESGRTGGLQKGGNGAGWRVLK